MSTRQIDQLFDISGQVAVVTGGAGVLCAEICKSLAAEKVKVAILDINLPTATALATEIGQAGGDALAVKCDVCDKGDLEQAAQAVLQSWGKVDILVNGAGGNSPKATTAVDKSFFDLAPEALRWVTELNLMGTLLPCQVFGKRMAAHKEGVIINISSMNAVRPLSRIPAYSAAKAAVSNFTQWLAVHMAQEYSPELRVNAIAPGFFLTDQNHYLLVDKESGELTERGQAIITHTPSGRFGIPQDLLSTVIWLLSPGSRFVTGIVVPVDGGFSAFSGV